MDSMKFPAHGKPEWPPRRVWREVDDAARVWDDLQSQGREVHFEIDDNGGLRMEMRDLDGNVISPLSAFEVLALASSPAPPSA